MTTSLKPKKKIQYINIFPNTVGEEEKTENDATYHKFIDKQNDYKQKTKELRVMITNLLKKKDDLIEQNPESDKIVEIQNEFNRLGEVLQKLHKFEDLDDKEKQLFIV